MDNAPEQLMNEDLISLDDNSNEFELSPSLEDAEGFEGEDVGDDNNKKPAAAPTRNTDGDGSDNGNSIRHTITNHYHFNNHYHFYNNHHQGPPQQSDYESAFAHARAHAENIDERHKLRSANAAEKVRIMVRLMKIVDGGFRATEAGDKTFVKRELKHFSACFTTHFNSDAVAFCAAFPDYQHTTHGKQCKANCTRSATNGNATTEQTADL